MEGGGIGRPLRRGINRNPNANTEAEIRRVLYDMITRLEEREELEEARKAVRLTRRHKQIREMEEDRVRDPDELSAIQEALGLDF
tara:strand:+ start:56 stop:310 length:255 start_codon:yes stop_codon:yes gene_type:complete